MSTSPYFNNQNATREQWLLEDLIIESIRNHGIDIYYLPRSSQSQFDVLFGDDPVKCYREAIKLDMYLESFSDYTGNKEFFSKFGLEIQETAKIAVARRTFERFIPHSKRNLPKEGDLIYLPIQMKLMEIKFVEEERNFFQLGRDSRNPYMYILTIEAFKYNGELINTGIEELDQICNSKAFGLEYNLTTGTGTFSTNEIVYQGASLATAAAKGYVSDWDITTKKLRLRNIKGEFNTTDAIIGSESNASWTMTSVDEMQDVNGPIDDNRTLETLGTQILDFSESNPFGEP